MLPDLCRRLQLCSLLDASQTNDDGSRILGRTGIQRSAALWAEHLRAAITALSDLDILLGRSFHRELCDGRSNDGTERRTRKDLAISAVANHYARRIDVGGEGDCATVASAVDVHMRPPL